MAEQTRQMYFITSRDLPVAIALDDVTYTDAMAVAGQCVADGQILTGPDDGSVGYIVNFNLVAGVTVISRKPTGPAMQMPADLVKKLVAESRDDFVTTPDDSGTDDILTPSAPTTRKLTEGPPEIWEFTAREAGAVLIEAGQWLSRCQGTQQERDVEGAAWVLIAASHIAADSVSTRHLSIQTGS